MEQAAEELSEEEILAYVQELKSKYPVVEVSDEGLYCAVRVSMATAKAAMDRGVSFMAVEDFNTVVMDHFKTRPQLWVPGLRERGMVASMEGDVIAGLSVWISRHLGETSPMYTEMFTFDIERNALLMGTDLSKIMRTRIEGKLSSKRLGTTLRAGVENIKNYTYLANTSVPVTNSAGEITSFKNNAAVKQFGGNIQVFTAMLQQKFKLGIFHLDGEVVYQKSSEQSVLPLPELSAYGNLYLHTALVKNVLQVSLGADVRYFTKYNAPDYSPVIGQFYLQNPNNEISVGGCPMINVYANLHWKRTRIFLMMYNVNQSKSGYFLAPHYPINPRMLKLGISWNFFD